MKVPTQFDSDRAYIFEPSETRFVGWMRRYIDEVMAATDDKVLSLHATAYSIRPAPDYSANTRDFRRMRPTESVIASSRWPSLSRNGLFPALILTLF